MEENNEFKNPQNTDNSVDSATNNIQPPKSNKTKKVITGVVCIVVVAGVITGVALNKDKLFKKETNTNTTISQSEDASKNTSTQENTVEEIKSTIKIDESKPWVYDADYGYNKPAKTITNNMGTVYDSTDELIVPYINVNSDYAKSVNEELKSLYEKEYSLFGGAYPELKISDGYLPKIQYQFSAYNDILSLSVQKFTGVINGDDSIKYYTYNINLKTLDKASLADVYTAAGFSSESYFNEMVQNTIANEIADGNLVEEDIKLDYKLFFLDKNRVFNLVLTSPSGNPGAYHIIPGTEKKTNTNTQNQTTETPTDLSQFKGLFYRNNYVETTTPGARDYYELYFDLDGKPTIKIGSKSSEQTEAYFITQEIKNLKTDVAAGSSYVSFDFTAWTPSGDTTGSATIRYSSVNYNFTIGVKASINMNGTAKIFGNNGQFVELTEQGVSAYIFKDEFTDNSKEITLYGKYFSTFPGTSARNRVYYINANNELCKTFPIEGAYQTDILAKNVRSVKTDLSDTKLHIYPMASTFTTDDIYLEDECTYYENIYFDPNAYYSANNKGDMIQINNKTNTSIHIKFNHAYDITNYNRKIEGTAKSNQEGIYEYIEQLQGKEYKLTIKIIDDTEIEMAEWYDNSLKSTEHLFR